MEPNNEQAIPNLLTELNIFSDPDSRSFVEQKSPHQFFFTAYREGKVIYTDYYNNSKFASNETSVLP